MPKFVTRIGGTRTVTLPNGERGGRATIERRAGGSGRLTIGAGSGIEVLPGGSVTLRWVARPPPSLLARLLIFLRLQAPTPMGDWVEAGGGGEKAGRRSP